MYMERYIVMRILLGLFALFVVIFLIVRIAGGGSEESALPEVITNQSVSTELPPVNISEQADTASTVRFSIMGTINSLEEHREIRFSISKTQRVVQIIEGYDGKVLKTMRLDNTENSYQQFLYAIDYMGYTEERAEPTLTEREGVCSHGKQYLYQFTIAGLVRSDLWSDSCNRNHGTFGGDRRRIVALFENQFPEYDSFVRGTRL